MSEGTSDGTVPNGLKLAQMLPSASLFGAKTTRGIKYCQDHTVMLKQLVLVAALPQNSSLFGADNLPWPQIYCALVGGILK
jgi:hypothetical protein